jgi:hypothetical protein
MWHHATTDARFHMGLVSIATAKFHLLPIMLDLWKQGRFRQLLWKDRDFAAGGQIGLGWVTDRAVWEELDIPRAGTCRMTLASIPPLF